MANRVRPTTEAVRLAEWQLVQIGRELRVARIAAGKRLLDVARAVRVSPSYVSRIERGRRLGTPYRLLAEIAGYLGLKLSLQAFPALRRLLDAPQLALFKDLRTRCHTVWSWETEVPMSKPGDLRAADARATRPGCSVMFELLTRFSDFQAQSRAALLKQRDIAADRVVLVILGSNANRRALREAGDAVRASFPLGTRTVLRALARGEDPGANGIVLL
jgi:transcriptional regulator with XRE-family HTH domain